MEAKAALQPIYNSVRLCWLALLFIAIKLLRYEAIIIQYETNCSSNQLEDQSKKIKLIHPTLASAEYYSSKNTIELNAEEEYVLCWFFFQAEALKRWVGFVEPLWITRDFTFLLYAHRTIEHVERAAQKSALVFASTIRYSLAERSMPACELKGRWKRTRDQIYSAQHRVEVCIITKTLPAAEQFF